MLQFLFCQMVPLSLINVFGQKKAFGELISFFEKFRFLMFAVGKRRF